MKGATLVVVAGKAACGAPGGLAHGRDVAEAMGRGGGGRRLVGASSLAWPGRQASPATCAGGLCRGTEQGRVRERREEREKGERRVDRWPPWPCGVHVSKTTLKTTGMAKYVRF